MFYQNTRDNKLNLPLQVFLPVPEFCGAAQCTYLGCASVSCLEMQLQFLSAVGPVPPKIDSHAGRSVTPPINVHVCVDITD